jgi:hypothetical protein
VEVLFTWKEFDRLVMNPIQGQTSSRYDWHPKFYERLGEILSSHEADEVRRYNDSRQPGLAMLVPCLTEEQAQTRPARIRSSS